jgi:hypothetical protein
VRHAWPVLVALLLAGCAGDDSSATTTTTTVDETSILDGTHDYVLLDAPVWELVQAVDYAAGDPQTTEVPADVSPPTDWRADYVHGSDTIVIRAVDGTLDETASLFSGTAVPTEEVADFPWRARATVFGRDLAPDSFVLVHGGDQTIVVSSPSLNDEELVALAEHLRPVDEATWVSAGGTAEPSI